MSQQKAPVLFKCVTCGKEHHKHPSLRSHTIVCALADVLHECDRCEKNYKRRRDLVKHKQTSHLEGGQFECGECGKLCPNKKALSEHKQRVHSDRMFKCPVCGKTMRPRSASGHMGTHTGKPCVCEVCATSHRTANALIDHKWRVHSEAKHRCEHCGKIFREASDLRSHTAIHDGEPCECDVCGTIYRNRSALSQHKRQAHSEAKHRCEHCGKIFRWACALRRHAATHDEKREEYPCARCPRTFKSREGHEKHMEIEHSDSRFTCDSECDLHSATRSEYRDHLKSHHTQQHPATCKCLSVDVDLAQQIATKLGNAAFVEAGWMMKCTDGECDFTTTCARHMESHKDQRHHDVYQPVLRCSSCQTWFTRPTNLKSHNANKHQRERRFKS